MNAGLYAAFVLATAVLIVIPGPTAMLVTATSLKRGTRAGLIAVAGSTSAVAVQLAIVVVGFASVVTLAASAFEWIRFVGVAYLIYLGLGSWWPSGADAAAETRGPGGGVPAGTRVAGGRRAFVQGFAVTLTNPKTLLFLGAFLPQFVDPALPRLPQLLVLAPTFLVVAGVLDSCWALAAGRAGALLGSARSRRWVDRLSGAILIGAAVALAAARRTP